MSGEGTDGGWGRGGLLLSGVCAALLLAPSALVWMVRGTAYALHCTPTGEACAVKGPVAALLGPALRDTLALAWALDSHTFLLVILSFAAGIGALTARHVLLAVLALLFLPLLALFLPMIAVLTAKHPDCVIRLEGVGRCVLWGTEMGRSFHTAAAVPDIVYDTVPYTFALALMLGLVGWFLGQLRAAGPRRAMAHDMRRNDGR